MNLKKYFDAANAAEARVSQIASQIDDQFNTGQTEKALELRPQLDKAKAEAKEAQQLYLSMQSATVSDGDPARKFVPAGGDAEPKVVKDLRASNEYMNAFFSAFKVGASPKTVSMGMHRAEQFGMLMNALTETGGSPAGSEGGFLLPIDFDNMIKELMRSFTDLSNHVNVEEVTAYSGWRAVETSAAASAFAKLTENDALPAAESPTFTKVEYTIEDYGGYLPVTNDLLVDTPVNIMRYLGRWMSKKVVLTKNSLILAIINAITPTNVTDSDLLGDAIKTALNKTLDPDISASASIFFNQTGFDLIDQVLDGDGRPLLQPDPTNATAKRLYGRPVVVLADRLWANLSSGGTFTRVAVGDGRELLTLFQRAAFEMAATTIGGDAWRKNNTEVRGIMRADAVQVDSAAMALLKVTIPA